MVFSSAIFLLAFLPVFFVLYFLTPNKYRNYTALFSSLFFYFWGEPRFGILLVASTLTNFFIVQRMHSAEAKQKKVLLWASVILNIGLLAYFKYCNFFIENVNAFLQGFGLGTLDWVNVVLPIGISFFTFQSLTYTIDVYRGVHDPLEKWSDHMLYITLFPQLIAGPIVRFNTIADQLIERTSSYHDRVKGFNRFVIGLSKKVLIANTLGEFVDAEVMAMDKMDSLSAWLVLAAYTFQIYFDFSGYSDMAIGLGRMMGFKFPENFNNPYVARSISDFWRRWHITLSEWMRDYLYIPLGGNRVQSNGRLYFNLITVFLISGLWHGASWNFVLWGAYHGLFLILDRAFLIQAMNRLGGIPSRIITFFIVSIGWSIFRFDDLSQLGDFYDIMFSFEITDYRFPLDLIPVLIAARLLSIFTLVPKGDDLQGVFYGNYNTDKKVIMATIAALLFLAIDIAYITGSSFNPFIYFRF